MCQQEKHLTRERIADALLPKKNTLILLHARPDGDAIGSAFALRVLLEHMGGRAYCLSADEIPERLRFLCQGLQQSILPDSLPADFEVEQVVCVDVASPSQLGGLAASWLSRVQMCIDHHATRSSFAPSWVESDASATGELIWALAKLWEEQGALDAIGVQAATLMYAAIASDTGGFRYSNVTPTTHRIAADLLALGVDAASVNHELFECKPYELMLAEQIGFSRLRRYRQDKVAIVPFDFATQTQNGLSNEHLETLVDVARCVRGTLVAIAIRQPGGQNQYRVSVRSNGAFSAAALCAAFGGGGHEKAAGCTIEADDMESVIERLLAEIDAQGVL